MKPKLTLLDKWAISLATALFLFLLARAIFLYHPTRFCAFHKCREERALIGNVGFHGVHTVYLGRGAAHCGAVEKKLPAGLYIVRFCPMCSKEFIGGLCR